jgi:hypothetical protein
MSNDCVGGYYSRDGGFFVSLHSVRACAGHTDPIPCTIGTFNWRDFTECFDFCLCLCLKFFLCGDRVGSLPLAMTLP